MGHVSFENIGRRIAIRWSEIDRDVNFAKKTPNFVKMNTESINLTENSSDFVLVIAIRAARRIGPVLLRLWLAAAFSISPLRARRCAPVSRPPPCTPPAATARVCAPRELPATHLPLAYCSLCQPHFSPEGKEGKRGAGAARSQYFWLPLRQTAPVSGISGA